MYWTQRSEGPCLGGYHNDANYCRIDRPSCGGGFICTVHNGVKGHVLGGGGTAMIQIIAGLTGQVVGGFICTGHNRVKGHVWGGYHNEANYSGIDKQYL